MGQMVSSIVWRGSVLSWNTPGLWYPVSVSVHATRPVVWVSCACQAFGGCCKHVLQVFHRIIAPRLRQAQRFDVRAPEWDERPGWCTDAEIAAHSYLRDTQPEAPRVTNPEALALLRDVSATRPEPTCPDCLLPIASACACDPFDFLAVA